MKVVARPAEFPPLSARMHPPSSPSRLRDLSAILEMVFMLSHHNTDLGSVYIRNWFAYSALHQSVCQFWALEVPRIHRHQSRQSHLHSPFIHVTSTDRVSGPQQIIQVRGSLSPSPAPLSSVPATPEAQRDRGL
ncbi:hypothetical protein E2C01_036981 [Portunus trituberculatus]|uniref:Uncharacterized protein n=1 Tax=Portunus trituberculatus TaxID=210409 RepID=A0A5B7FCR0_PORTR|nr:hypothetical protein [Portunus trituberculatus]